MPHSESTFQFANVLEEMNRGRTAKDIDHALKQVLDSCADLGRAGELTIKLKVLPTKRNLNEVTATITTKLPQEKAEPSIFFFNDRNELVRDDPRQKELPFPQVMRREEVPQVAEAHNA